MGGSSFDALRDSILDLTNQIETLSGGLQDLEDALKSAGGGGGGVGAGRVPLGGAGEKGAGGGVGGLLPGVAGRLLKNPAAIAGAAAAAAVAVAASSIGQGIEQAATGGDFSAGATQQLARLASKIPVLGAVSGLEDTIKAQDATAGSAGRLLGDLAAGGFQLDRGTEDYLIRETANAEIRRVAKQRGVNNRVSELFERRNAEQLTFGLSAPATNLVSGDQYRTNEAGGVNLFR